MRALGIMSACIGALPLIIAALAVEIVAMRVMR